MNLKKLPTDYDYLAPDTAEIRLLLTPADATRASLAHCRLPPLKTSIATKHRSVEELWYFTQGEGEIWLKNEECERFYPLTPGVAITIPPHTIFQYRNLSAKTDLEFIVTTIPHWPGPQEAIQTYGKWPLETDIS